MAHSVDMMAQQEVLSSAATTNEGSSSGSEQCIEHPSDILDSSKFDLKLDKSNILMLGPTGSGTPLALASLSVSVCLYVRRSVCSFLRATPYML